MDQKICVFSARSRTSLAAEFFPPCSGLSATASNRERGDEADIEANILFQNVVNATAASFTVNQTNPGIGPVTVKISAWDTAAEPGVNFVDGLTGDTHIAITSFSITNVVVKTGNTQFTPAAAIDADGNLIVTA